MAAPPPPPPPPAPAVIKPAAIAADCNTDAMKKQARIKRFAAEHTSMNQRSVRMKQQQRKAPSQPDSKAKPAITADSESDYDPEASVSDTDSERGAPLEPLQLPYCLAAIFEYLIGAPQASRRLRALQPTPVPSSIMPVSRCSQHKGQCTEAL